MKQQRFIESSELTENQTHDLLKSCVMPRPIAWVATIGLNDIPNVAPFSCFTFLSSKPAYIGFSVAALQGSKKGTLANIERTEDFVVNVAGEKLASAVNISAATFPPEINKVEAAGVHVIPAVKVRSHRIAESPIQMECKLYQIFRIGESSNSFVIGKVLAFHIDEDLYNGSSIDAARLKPLARLHGDYYAGLGNIFELPRPWLLNSGGKTR